LYSEQIATEISDVLDVIRKLLIEYSEKLKNYLLERKPFVTVLLIRN